MTRATYYCVIIGCSCSNLLSLSLNILNVDSSIAFTIYFVCPIIFPIIGYKISTKRFQLEEEKAKQLLNGE